MTKLKLGPVPDERPVKVTIELPAAVHRDLVAYAEALGRENGQKLDPTRLVAPMLARFMAGDRGFRKVRGRPSHPQPQSRASDTAALGCPPAVTSRP